MVSIQNIIRHNLVCTSSDMEKREEEREEREDQVDERREWRGVSTRFFFFELRTLIGVKGREALAEFPVGLADVGVLG